MVNLIQILGKNGQKIRKFFNRDKCASANRGVKFSQARIDKSHGNRSSESYSHPHTEETKAKIGQLSALKFTPEYIINLKSAMYKAGHWINPIEKSDYDIYYELSNWIQPMWNLFDSFENGVFNSKKNPKGMVRDHILSRKDGLFLRIWPELLRHPANCQLLTHAQNVSKRSKSGFTYEQLCDKIIKYSNEWIEQEICLKRIAEYSNGKVYIRKGGSNGHQ
jgi:hypothetical protein